MRGLELNKYRDICFTAEATLGKLAKWLRILGFDTDYQSVVTKERFINAPEQERIVLTRTQQVRDRNTDRRLIFITSNNPFDQVREVIRVLGIEPEDTRPFSRCTRCNILIEDVDRKAVRDRVPDYIWQINSEFQICRRCRRIYWLGSHTKHSRDIIKRFFN